MTATDTQTTSSVDPGIISAALLGQESGNNPNAPTSIDGAVGQAQITPGTWAQYALPNEDINNPNDNLAVHQRIVDDLSDRFNGDPARVAVGYFSGPGNVAPADSDTPWKKDRADGNGKTVSSYVSDVMGRIGNAIVPQAHADEMSYLDQSPQQQVSQDVSGEPKAVTSQQSNPYDQLTDAEWLAEAKKQGVLQDSTQGYHADIGAQPYGTQPGMPLATDTPVEKAPLSQMGGDTGVPHGSTSSGNPYDAMTDAEWMAEAQKQGLQVNDTKTTMGLNHQQMLAQAEKSMGPQGSAMGLWANLVGAGANASHDLSHILPGLSSGGSALAALAGAGQGDTFSDRFNYLEKAQQAMREAYKNNEPIIHTPSYLPDITPSGLEDLGTTVAGGAAFTPIAKSGSYLGAIAKGLGLGGLEGAFGGASDTNAFLPSDQAAEQRAENAGTGAEYGAVGGAVLGAAGRAIQGPVENATADAAKSVASGFYKAADDAGGVIDNPAPIFDQMRGKDPVTPTEIALAKTDPVRKFLNDFKDSSTAPMTLSDAQGIDEELSNRIDQQFDKINGMSKDGYKLLDAQTKFRQGLAATPPQSVGGGQAGYEAWQNGQQAWQQAMKLSSLERMQARANLTANPPTSLQTQLKNYLTSPASRNLFPEERQALMAAQKRGFLGDTLHVLGSRLVPYVGTMVGESVGSLPGAIIGGAIGHGGSALARYANTAMQNGKLTNALNIIGKGIPTP